MTADRHEGQPGRRAWSAEQVRALGVRTDLVTACEIVYDCGETKARELYRSGQLDFPALRRGRKIVVPTAPLLALLGLASDTAAAPTRTRRRSPTSPRRWTQAEDDGTPDEAA